MGDIPGVCHGLGAATLVLRPRDAILRPDLHGYPQHIVALPPEKVPRHAGIDPAAHPKENAFFFAAHFPVKVMALRRPVNAGRTGTLTKALPARVNRHGNCLERLIPIRGSSTTSMPEPVRGNRQWRRSAQILIS